MKINLRLLYLYLFSFVGLLIIVIGGIRLVDLGMKVYVFKDADKYEIYPDSTFSKEEMMARQERETTRQRQRDVSSSLAMILIGTPLYLFHLGTIQKESNPRARSGE